jgi:hypothetical protein
MVGPSPRGSLWAITGVATVLSCAATVAALFLLQDRLRYVFRHHSEDEPSDDDDFEWQDSNEPSPFPWEPKSASKSYSFREPNYDVENLFAVQDRARNTRHNNNSKSFRATRDQKLDLLASMTFANGGLRAPSCPCCF